MIPSMVFLSCRTSSSMMGLFPTAGGSHQVDFACKKHTFILIETYYWKAVLRIRIWIRSDPKLLAIRIPIRNDPTIRIWIRNFRQESGLWELKRYEKTPFSTKLAQFSPIISLIWYISTIKNEKLEKSEEKNCKYSKKNSWIRKGFEFGKEYNPDPK